MEYDIRSGQRLESRARHKHTQIGAVSVSATDHSGPRERERQPSTLPQPCEHFFTNRCTCIHTHTHTHTSWSSLLVLLVGCDSKYQILWLQILSSAPSWTPTLFHFFFYFQSICFDLKKPVYVGPIFLWKVNFCSQTYFNIAVLGALHLHPYHLSLIDSLFSNRSELSGFPSVGLTMAAIVQPNSTGPLPESSSRVTLRREVLP